MLRDLELEPVYDSANRDLIADLVVPLLRNSVDYMRGVGFFTSGWLRVASAGVSQLVENGGRARIILSPIMDAQDWEAFTIGEKARCDEALRAALKRNLDNLTESLEQNTLNSLAWLIADELLEFRFAVPRPQFQGGDYHDKVGVFVDARKDVVAIHGSFNDTIKGTLNGEAFSVFKSWEPGQACFSETHRQRLASLWENGNRQFGIHSIPDAIRDEFIRLRSSSERPYPLSEPVVSLALAKTPRCPFELREFQRNAIQAWEDAGCRGILEMATGTGKTITSLAAAASRRKSLGKLVLIILVPYIHLLEQWERTCREFGFHPYLCSGDRPGWEREAKSVLQDFRLGSIDDACFIAVHNTASADKFRRLCGLLPPQHSMLIADEVHDLGSRELRQALFPEAGMRMGLSATPQRWFDDEGTHFLLSYFDGVCFEYPLESAIGECLVPYEYNPVPVCLTETELQGYGELTAKVVAIAGRAKEDPEIEERLKMLLLERARIIASADEKLPKLIEILRELMSSRRTSADELRHVLVYCAPGTHQEVLRSLSGLGLRCHEFVHTVGASERTRVLQSFADGDIQVIVAVKCLDEGVDVPATRTAFFLASTTNPREFIQRRGRILRKAEGKTKAIVYDFVVVPSTAQVERQDVLGASVLRREMPRFAEFSSSAMNQFEARSIIRDILDQYEMLNLLDERPWDLYRQLSGMERRGL